MSAEANPASIEAMSDEDLLAAIAARADKQAFAALFNRFAGRIKAFIIRAGTVPELAEEIAQEVMITVWHKADRFDASKAGAATWIFTIARNRRIDVIRRQARPEPDADDPLYAPDPPANPADRIAEKDRDAQVRAALMALSTEQREVVRLAFFSGLSHGDVAQELDVPLGTVKSRLRLAFKRLRESLGTEFSMELIDE